jgi:hypothetical protein
MLRIDINRWFAMVAILNPKWPPIYKNTKYKIAANKIVKLSMVSDFNEN